MAAAGIVPALCFRKMTSFLKKLIFVRFSKLLSVSGKRPPLGASLGGSPYSPCLQFFEIYNFDFSGENRPTLWIWVKKLATFVHQNCIFGDRDHCRGQIYWIGGHLEPVTSNSFLPIVLGHVEAKSIGRKVFGTLICSKSIR